MPMPLTFPASPAEVPLERDLAADAGREHWHHERPWPFLLGTLGLAVLCLASLAFVAWLFDPARSPVVAAANVPADLLARATHHHEQPGRFDRQAATRAIDMAAPAAAAACGLDARAGAIPLEITVAPQGRVARVRIIRGHLAGTADADCLARALERTPQAPFDGPPVTFTQSVLVDGVR